jgi:hypothetical protein
MGRWTCPHCDREFSRAGQSHTCVPGGTVEETFAGRPPVQREIYDALMSRLDGLGEIYVDAVGVGVFLSHEAKFAEARPRARGLALYLILPRTLAHPRVSRKERISARRMGHVLVLTSVADVDDELGDWLAEAYLAAS